MELLEHTNQSLMQVSPAHSILFISRIKNQATIHEAYQVTIPRDQAPILGTEPLIPVALRIIYNTIDKANIEDRIEYSVRANRCITREVDKIRN